MHGGARTLEREVAARTAAALPLASEEVVSAWGGVCRAAAADLPAMGLAAGDRPAADVEVLAGVVAAAEYELAVACMPR